MSPHFLTVDLLFSPTALSVQWRGVPGEFPRPVEPATLSRIDQQRTALEEAERRGPPAALAAAQRQLGATLFLLLDGPERALQRRLDDARAHGVPLHLVLRLRSSEPKALPHHPALGWHLQLLTPPPPSSEPPLALQSGVTLTVQLGEVEAAAPEVLKDGRFQLLFMASSPRDVEPVLDYEAEEERILEDLAPFAGQRLMVVRVAEDGTLAELRRRLMQRAYDIVHLSGHGIITDKGPRLLMENDAGDHDEISPEQLIKTLREGPAMPRLIVLSSCHTAEQRSDLPSLAAELLQGGLPCVVGWTQPVGDGVATRAAAELYHRLCNGEVPTQALAHARQHLHEEDLGRPLPLHAWATLQLLTTRPAGFRIDRNKPPAREETPAPEFTYRWLSKRMRVLERGFVGRRRELQALGRILRRGLWTARGEAERPVAGAVVIGMKGQGKSCLVGRALERHLQDTGALSMVVLHGALDEFTLMEAFRAEAVRLDDSAAEALLGDGTQPLMRRLERLLRHHWRERHLVIVLDDFEQNLDIPGEGAARLHPLAASLLEVLVPACQDEQPKVLITSTAHFALPARLQGALAELTLGALEGASVRKLWFRGQLSHVLPSDWTKLSERLGRNARILDWARQLLEGKTPSEVRDIAARAGQELLVWTDAAPDKVQQDALVALFLKHMAYTEAQAKVGPDALTFIERARVYDEPVPAEALAGLTEGLSLSLDHHLVALANLGLLEVGTEEGTRVYRVSPLVKETFDAPDGERWHAVAAAYWWTAAKRSEGLHAASVIRAWGHALHAKQQALADEAGDIIYPWLDGLGHFAQSADMGQQHVNTFPNSITGQIWVGYALFRKGRPQEGLPLLRRSVELAKALSSDLNRLSLAQNLLARVLTALGEHSEARKQFEDLVAAEEQACPDGSYQLAKSLHGLAGVLKAQGDLPAARALLERSLLIKKKVLGTEDHPDVSATLHALADVLQFQGDLPAAHSLLERSMNINKKVHGTEEHPDIAASLHGLAVVLKTQGDLPAARSLLEQSIEINKKVHGTEEHPDVAASLHELAKVLKVQGDLTAARSCIERSMDIDKKVLGTEEHPDVATSLQLLASVLRAQRDLPGARSLLERSLLLQKKIFGTDEHPDVATSLHALAGVLQAQGNLSAACDLLERSLFIKKKVFGTEEHPEVATNYATIAVCLQGLGLLDESEAAFRKAIVIYEQVHQTRDHYMIAEAEIHLSYLLISRNRQEEARPLHKHAVPLLQAQIPNHPLLLQFQKLASSPSVNPNHLARAALRVRRANGMLPKSLIADLHILRTAGEPHSRVADFLEQLAQGGPLPPAPPNLPEDAANFIASVRQAAEGFPPQP